MLIKPFRQRPILQPLLNIIPPQFLRNALHSLPLVRALAIHPKFGMQIINHNILRPTQVPEVNVPRGSIRYGIFSTNPPREADETRVERWLVLEHFGKGS